MQYIEPGSTSQSLVMFLQDAVTGVAYSTEDQTNMTFDYIREGDASATQDASITAGTLGTWADGTAKPFGTTGEWQIDFADAAFAAGEKYVKLLVTHDNGDFIPKTVIVDLSVRQADAVEISGDSTAADNLELMYDGTGYTDDSAPASRSQLDGLTITGSAVHQPCNDADDGFVLTTGSEANDEDSTHALDGTEHELSDDAGTLDCYYKFDITGDSQPTGVTFKGIFNGGNDDFGIYVNTGSSASPSWERRGTIEGLVSTTNTVSHTIDLYYTDILTDLHEVWVRIYGTGLSSSSFDVDQVFLSKSVVNRSVGYADGAIWVDTNLTNTHTENYIDGTADNPVSTWAAALTLSGQLGLKRFHIAGGSSIELTGDSSNYEIYGKAYGLALGGQTITNAGFIGARVSGIGVNTGTAPVFEYCGMGTVTLGQSRLYQCGIGRASGTFTAGSAGQFILVDCFSLVPGSGTPSLTFSGTGSTTGINVRGWKGGANFTLDGDCTLSHEVLAGGGQTFTTGGANVELRGLCREVTLVLSGAGTVQAIVNTGPITISGTATTTVNLYGTNSATTDTSVNTTVNDYMVSRTSLNGGDYALDTDANGRMRIVDGTGAGEVALASGTVDVGLIEGGDATDQINAACDAAISDRGTRFLRPTRGRCSIGHRGRLRASEETSVRILY